MKSIFFFEVINRNLFCETTPYMYNWGIWVPVLSHRMGSSLQRPTAGSWAQRAAASLLLKLPALSTRGPQRGMMSSSLQFSPKRCFFCLWTFAVVPQSFSRGGKSRTVSTRSSCCSSRFLHFVQSGGSEAQRGPVGKKDQIGSEEAHLFTAEQGQRGRTQQSRPWIQWSGSRQWQWWVFSCFSSFEPQGWNHSAHFSIFTAESESEVDQSNTGTLNSLHTPRSGSSSTTLRHHGDPLRAKSSSQVAEWVSGCHGNHCTNRSSMQLTLKKNWDAVNTSMINKKKKKFKYYLVYSRINCCCDDGLDCLCYYSHCFGLDWYLPAM